MREKINLILGGAVLFAATQSLGIIIALKLGEMFGEEGTKWSTPPWWWGLVCLFGFALFFLVLKKASTRVLEVLLKTAFVILIIGASQLLLCYFVSPFLALAFAVVLILTHFLLPRVWALNLTVIFIFIAYGLFFGGYFSPWVIVGILAVIAVYDVIAVCKTKHMIKIAEELIRSRVFLGLIIPNHKISDFNATLKEAESDLLNKILNDRKAERFSLLGGGDLLLPLGLAISVLFHSGVINSFIVAGFALMGLFVVYTLFFFLKERPFPALAPIAVFAIIGYFVASLI